MSINAFFAYPAQPLEVGQTIRAAYSDVIQYHGSTTVKLWEALDIPGRFIADTVLEEIRESEFMFADVTQLNFNVTFEVGYALGLGKRVYLLRYAPLAHMSVDLVAKLGVFDTLGVRAYQNQRELAALLKDPKGSSFNFTLRTLNPKAPLYITEDRWRTDDVNRIISRIKKTRMGYRSFDPSEQTRLSAREAIDQVSQSYGVLVRFVPSTHEDADLNNLRGAFIAGLAQGMDKVTLLLQSGDDPVPIDYRDLVCSYMHPGSIDEYVAEFSGRVYDAMQNEVNASSPSRGGSLLDELDLGASSAENELRDLADYYLPTDGFRRALRGDVRLVLGRKGSGKTAIFLQVRDKKRSRKNLVLDLKPDGYRLVKFRDRVLRNMDQGSAEHTVTAFWEFLITMELVHKALELDRDAARYDHVISGPYRNLQGLYRTVGYDAQGDFSERIGKLMQRIESDFEQKYKGVTGLSLDSPQVTELVHTDSLAPLQDALHNYLIHKDSVWILFDNIDKGWSSRGVQDGDLLVVRALVEAARKVEREFQRRGIEAHSLLFLRNDVYELLVDEMPDRGKEAKAVLDWTNADMLRELVLLRARHSRVATASGDFKEFWSSVCTSHVDGQESSQYLVDRCLMRPRYLIDLINHCRGNALTLRHERMEQDDLKAGVALLSSDLTADLAHELRDIVPEAADFIYAFTGAARELSQDDVTLYAMEAGIPDQLTLRMLDLLLWFGFLGVLDDDDEARYIYHVGYNSKILAALRSRRDSRAPAFQINPAFWPALSIR